MVLPAGAGGSAERDVAVVRIADVVRADAAEVPAARGQLAAERLGKRGELLPVELKQPGAQNIWDLCR